MKKLIHGLVILLTVSAVVNGGAIDDFNSQHNYLTDGTDGTVWDGLLLNSGIHVIQDAVGTRAAATSGDLTLESSWGNWEWGSDDGYLLYIDVPAGSDFTANVLVSDYTWVEWHDVGLMARAVPGTAENYVMHRYFPMFGVDNALRSVVDDAQAPDDNGTTDAAMPYLQLEKAGSTFTIRASTDGITYKDITFVERTDMTDVELQVGIYQATFTENEGSASFDDFEITLSGDTIASNFDPADGRTMVEVDSQLTWDAPLNYTAVGYDVLFGTDANELDGDMEKIVDGLDVLTADPAMHSSITGDMDYETLYYWRVDTFEPNTPSPIVHTGELMSFTTIPIWPIISEDPIGQTVASGTMIDLSVIALNTETYTWYQSDDAVADAGDTEVGTGQTIQVMVDDLNDEGWYYCVASAPAGSVTSGMAQVMIERLVGHWEFEGDLADSVADEVPGALTHDGSASEPNFVSGVPELGGGQAYKFFGDGRVVTIADSIDFFNFYPQGMTISCWVKDQNPSISDIVCSKEGDPETGYLLSRNPQGAGAFAIHPSEATSANSLVTVDEWHQLIGVHDPDAGIVRIYVDGTYGGDAADPTIFNGSNLAPLIFGAGGASSSNTTPEPGEPVIWTDKDVYEVGENIVVYFSNSTTNGGDWIALSLPDAAFGYYETDSYLYTNGAAEGSVTFVGGGSISSAGNYVVRLYSNDPPTDLLASYYFTVGSMTSITSTAAIDDVKIWNYALDETEIAQQYVDVMGGYICVGGNPTADLSEDCQVGLDDLAILAENWMNSNRID